MLKLINSHLKIKFHKKNFSNVPTLGVFAFKLLCIHKSEKENVKCNVENDCKFSNVHLILKYPWKYALLPGILDSGSYLLINIFFALLLESQIKLGFF